MAEVAWKEDFPSGAEQRALLQRQLTMGARHLDLEWGKTLWTHIPHIPTPYWTLSGHK